MERQLRPDPPDPNWTTPSWAGSNPTLNVITRGLASFTVNSVQWKHELSPVVK